MTEEQLRTLLQQRATQQPPEGYCDELLRKLYRQQRSELLQRSLWQIACDRIGTFWGEHSMSAPAYTLSLGALTLVGLLSIVAIKSSPSPGTSLAAGETRPKQEVLPASAVQHPERSREHPKRPVETQAVRFEQPQP